MSWIKLIYLKEIYLIKFRIIFKRIKMQVKNKKSLINFRAPATNNFMINSQEGSLIKGQIGN